MESPDEGPVGWATSTHMLTGWVNSLFRAQITFSYSSIMLYHILAPPRQRMLSCKVVVSGNSKRGCSVQGRAEGNPSTSHALTHQDPVPPSPPVPAHNGQSQVLWQAWTWQGVSQLRAGGRKAGAAGDRARDKGWRKVCSERSRSCSDLTLNGAPVTWVGCVGGVTGGASLAN